MTAAVQETALLSIQLSTVWEHGAGGGGKPNYCAELSARDSEEYNPPSGGREDHGPPAINVDSTNPADAYRRLEELYAQMSNEQIEDMVGKMDHFTDVAKQVLRAEVSRRGLDRWVRAAPRETVRQGLLAAKAKV